jgi:NAD(P)-dependent dehydrogenase (short-subunit alcohol dehydrogenase family)
MCSLAVEWGPQGVRANSIVPGPVAGTEGMDRLGELTGADAWRESIPLGRYAELDEIGRMAALLVSPWSSYLNGARVVVDGGFSLVGPALVNRALMSPREN